MTKIRVLIVDDSAVVRQMLTAILDAEPDIEVVGTAADPYIARKKIKELNPDVLTLDVEMPRMDGLTFLRNLMRLRPMPVIMISSLTEHGAEITLDALDAGAVDFISKPKIDVKQGLQEYSEEIVSKLRSAAQAKVRSIGSQPIRQVDPSRSADAVLKSRTVKKQFRTTERIIAVGSSTGGTEAIKEILTRMPPDAPGMVLSQHIPEAFSAPFARRIDSLSAMNVCEAQDGQQILPGHAYIAPGSHHLIVVRDGARYLCRLSDGPPVNRHRPSVDVLFRSVAQCVGSNAIGVLLTGMGKDGALGLKEMQEAGSHTIAQDEKTSVVWGMPGEAVKLGAANEIQPLEAIAECLLSLPDTRKKKHGT